MSVSELLVLSSKIVHLSFLPKEILMALVVLQPQDRRSRGMLSGGLVVPLPHS